MTNVKTTSYFLITLVIISLSFYSCRSSKSPSFKEHNFNYKYVDEVLTGEIPLSLIRNSDTNYGWFSKNYNKYKVKEEVISDIKSAITEIEFNVYLGIWCGDTKRMLPKFVKILDFLEYDLTRVRFIALDKQKKSLNKIDSSLEITHVPTIIIVRNGNEINRIVENHVVSLESDIKNILTVNNYTHSLK